MEKIRKIKFIDITIEKVNYTNVTVNDLTVKDNHSYTVSVDNIVVHNCLTFHNTSYGSRNHEASTIVDLAKVARVPLIADGGISQPGNIAAALVLGATMTMCGNLLTGCTESPGKLVVENGITYKEYFGSASEFQDGKLNRIEGTKKLIPLKNKTILEQMTFIKECLQSSISYGGGNDLESLKYVKYI